MSTYLLIGLGGFVGANVRYLLANWVSSRWGVTFPYGTLLINVTGSFVLCFLATMLSQRVILNPALRLALLVGFLGSYTTFSTFSYEWLQLIQNGEVLRSLAYILSSVIGGGLAGGIGLLLGRAV